MPNVTKHNKRRNIRTKTNHLWPSLDEEYLDLVLKFSQQQLNVETYLSDCIALFQPLLTGNEFKSLIERSKKQDDQFELLRRHIDEKRYTVLLYKVAENEVHAPHHHHNVASTQILVEGRLHLREYDRVRRNDNGQLVARQTSERFLKPGDAFQSSEWKNNIHWFQAINGPAIIFNTNARGFETNTFDASEGSFGRRYVDPTSQSKNVDTQQANLKEDHEIICEEFDANEAIKRFANKSLSLFPTEFTPSNR